MPVDYTNLPEPRDLFAVPSVVTIYRVSLPVFNINFLHSTKHQLNKHKPTDYIFPTNSPWTTLNGSLKTCLREIILNFLLLWWQSIEKNLGKWAKLSEWNGHKGGLSHSIMIYIHNWQTRHFLQSCQSFSEYYSRYTERMLALCIVRGLCWLDLGSIIRASTILWLHRQWAIFRNVRGCQCWKLNFDSISLSGGWLSKSTSMVKFSLAWKDASPPNTKNQQ